MMRPVAAILVVSMLSCPSLLLAQATSASVSGRIADPSKARIADARVAAINAGTNARYESRTNGSGEYSLPNLPPGHYRIEVEKEGFRTLIKPDLIVHLQDVLAIDFEMPVGAASASITVTSAAPLLNTSDTAVSTLIDN